MNLHLLPKHNRAHVGRKSGREGLCTEGGIDYDEVFLSVARLDTVRLLIALTALKGWEMHHMDVKSAFLNCEL
jgi:hypothetical protein